MIMIGGWVAKDNDRKPRSNVDNFEEEKNSKTLKRDNVALEEVVEIIKEHRTKQKIEYVQLQDSASKKEITRKMREVKDIFYDTSNGMEWEKINIDAIMELKEEMDIDGMETFNEWMKEENNFFLLGKKIISLAEQNKILLEYTTLNDDFTKSLRDENRYQDEKEVGDKRPILESPSPSSRKTWSIEEMNNDPKIRREFRKDMEASGFTFSSSMTDEEDEDEDEKQEKETEKASPSSAKQGSKKRNKRKGKKKKK
ncbi:hypothetical protein RhiirA4_470358 [Rhizophagus irregularis]|uniref:Uncharacterized protein n=1 Tax=Rhizophagus irregularis TaxID=588596 RepID=A0A2I1H138_9GLOM|nr:hypothetical protein RhiirA4_470358 [Rhizophagus irregularis]